MPSIKLLKRAEFELFNSCERYEKQQKGLSKYFRNEISKILKTVERNPNLYQKRYDTDFRFAPVDKFPFVVVFWFDEKLDTVFITSIFHTKRKPEL